MNDLWSRISNLGAKETDSKEHLRKIHLTNRMCFIAAFTTWMFVFHIYAVGNTFYAAVQAGCGTLASLFVLFNTKRLYRLSIYWTFFVILSNIFYCSLEMQGTGVEYFMIPLSLLPFVMEENIRSCYLFAILSFISFLLSHFIKASYIPHQLISSFNTELTYLVVLFAVFLVCFFIILQFKTVYGKYEQIIHRQKEMVEDKNREITESLRYARRIQRSLLPSEKYIENSIGRLKKEQTAGNRSDSSPS